MLEIIVETLGDALAAQAGGANQLDLKAGLPIRGLTPSVGMIEQVCRSVDMDVVVTIRPHARSFHYPPDEVAVMCGDIRRACRLGASGFLTGCLTEDGRIDREAFEALQEAAGELPLHVHLAWERAADPERALDALIALGVKSVRTSGLQPEATQAVERICSFAHQAAGRIALVLAGGVTLDNLPQLVAETGVPSVHVGRAARSPETTYGAVDQAKVGLLAEALRKATAQKPSSPA